MEALPLTAFAQEQTPAQKTAEDSDTLVKVIVKVRGDAVLASAEATGQGAEFIETPHAKKMAYSNQRTQMEAERRLRELYPDLQVNFHYSLVYNGFSCELPQGLIETAEALPEIESIEPVHAFHTPTPLLHDAPDLANAGAFYDHTGSYGEGEVICVLDTELDITHPMFSDLGNKEAKLQQADIEAICSTLTVEADPAQAYRSSKLPFVFDYADDSPYDVTNPADYHGTHVCGIAAGNAVDDGQGGTISGMARDAQIIFMRVFQYDEMYDDYFAPDDIMAAALEDAVKFSPDVINMSLGGHDDDRENVIYNEIIDTLSASGVVVCASAGNSGTCIEENDTLPPVQRIDYATVCSPSTLKGSFSVASADNSSRDCKYFKLTESDTPIEFSAISAVEFLTDFAGQTLRYEYCGLGYPEDFEGKDLTDTFALIDRGEIDFATKLANALQAGATGIIVCDNIPEEHLLEMAETDGQYAVFISMADGELLKNAAVKTISVDTEGISRIAAPTRVSDFSSRGLDESLELKPEIMGIGGNVVSANLSHGFEEMSGTSMASPYVAGAVAVVDGYLKSKGVVLSGEEKSRYIRNLMMNSAVLYKEENGLYSSPRAQGAGLVSLTNVITDKVIMTGTQNKAAIELYDKLGDTLEFDVVLTNISDEDVTFSSADIAMSTDDSRYDEFFGYEVIDGTQALTSTADTSGLLTIAAGESRTEHIVVKLDAAQLEQIGSVFTNGFFVDGFITLSGAENCCDISIPIVGFHGDWTASPIFATPEYGYTSYALSSTEIGSLRSNWDFGKILKIILDYVTTAPINSPSPFRDDYVKAMNAAFAEADAAGEFDEAGADAMRDTAYMSPNNDGIADNIGYCTALLRDAAVYDVTVRDESGTVVVSSDEPYSTNAVSYYIYGGLDEMLELKDGAYTGALSAHILYPGAENSPQTLEFPFVVDTKAPEVTQKTVQENGRTILELTVSDSSLDSILIVGNGRGGEEATFDPANVKSGRNLYTALYIGETYLTSGDMVSSTQLSVNLPWIDYVLGRDAGSESSAAISDYSFADLLLPETDADGTATIRYDITDLHDYQITVLDKAFNATQISDMDLLFNGFRKGVWMETGSTPCYYSFDTESSGTYYDPDADKTGTFTFGIEGIGPNFKFDGDTTPYAFDARVITPDKIEGRYFDEENETYIDVVYTYLGDITLDDVHAYTTEQLMELGKSYYSQTFGKSPNTVDVTYLADGSAVVELSFFNSEGELTENPAYRVDPRTGAGVDLYNIENAVSLADPTAVPETGTSAGKGDVDLDGTINASDAAEVLIAAAKLGAGADAELNETQAANADVNSDGDLNAADATIILVYAAAVGSGAENVTIADFIE